VAINFGKMLNENSVRRKLKRFHGRTDDLVNSTIISILRARQKRNNIIATGQICCVLCEQTPVRHGIAIIPDTDPEQGEDYVTLITYLCEYHTFNEELTINEIREKHVLPYLLSVRKEQKQKGQGDRLTDR
jgi:hypothetical protein